jgi:hypothetical protein
MALQVNYDYKEFDMIMYNAYWRINPESGILGGKEKIRYTIEIFKNAETARKKGSKSIKSITLSFIPDLSLGAPNFIVQAYNHAKSQPQFQGSVDV